MKDYLLDLVQHTYGVGVAELVKITGTNKSTDILAKSADGKSLIIFGKFNAPIPEFEGVFGMPNLSKLKIILGFDEYDEKAKISVRNENRDGEDIPVAIHFETQSGDFVNDYRLMTRNLVEDKVTNITFRGTNWDIEFVPSVASIGKLKKQISANSEEEHFIVRIENGDLKIHFGDHSTHYGHFVFQPNIKSKLNRVLKWNAKTFVAIMDLPGEKVIRISDKGIAEVSVDSGLANWQFLMPAQQK